MINNKLIFQFILYFCGTFTLFSFFLYREKNCIINYLKENQACLRKNAYLGDLFYQTKLAEKYYNHKKFNNALKWYKKTLKHGDYNSYYNLTDKFLKLKNRKKVFNREIKDEIVNWQKNYAEKGDGLAQKFLIDMYCLKNTQQQKKLEWYQKWRNKGWTTTNCLLKDKGLTVPKNIKYKLIIYKKLALEGYSQAEYEIGNILEKEGKKEEAKKWYRKASLNNNPEAQYSLGMSLILTNNLKKGMKWLKKSESYWKSPRTYFAIAGLMEYKYENREEAIKWYKKATVFNNPHSENSLALSYMSKEKATDRDKKEGIKWLKKSAQKGYGNSMELLGNFYVSENNIKEAIIWYKKMVSLHSSFGCYICHKSALIIQKIGLYNYIQNLQFIYEL